MPNTIKVVTLHNTCGCVVRVCLCMCAWCEEMQRTLLRVRSWLPCRAVALVDHGAQLGRHELERAMPSSHCEGHMERSVGRARSCGVQWV